jgi:hypothetical protein
LFDQLVAANVPVVRAGDAIKPRNLHAAVEDGAQIGRIVDGNKLFNPNNAMVNELPMDILDQLKS